MHLSFIMSLPLVSYHINGNLKSDGLKELGLVAADELKGKIKISLTLLGMNSLVLR